MSLEKITSTPAKAAITAASSVLGLPAAKAAATSTAHVFKKPDWLEPLGTAMPRLWGRVGQTAPKGPSSLTALGEADFAEKVLQSKQPVLVFISADWCGPCHDLQPFIEKLAKTRSNELSCFIMDADQLSKDFKSTWNAKNLPTVLIFEEGDLVADTHGFSSRTQAHIMSAMRRLK